MDNKGSSAFKGVLWGVVLVLPFWAAIAGVAGYEVHRPAHTVTASSIQTVVVAKAGD